MFALFASRNMGHPRRGVFDPSDGCSSIDDLSLSPPMIDVETVPPCWAGRTADLHAARQAAPPPLSLPCLPCLPPAALTRLAHIPQQTVHNLQ
jgi:hypothetical protein